jgi:hypothetical protein
VTFKLTQKVAVNGQEHRSLDELPPELRALYDKAVASGKKEVTVRRIVINGHEFDGMDEVPADMRNALVGALGGAKQTTSPIVIAVAILGAIILIALGLFRLK